MAFPPGCAKKMPLARPDSNAASTTFLTSVKAFIATAEEQKNLLVSLEPGIDRF
ncbi:MAG TPA: hypothetical protein VGP61_06560 [Gemmatimonadales bacterium]|jgi:hypothetical protein|nr:hypothetical protein [Gemmatimonadales bacterium]